MVPLTISISWDVLKRTISHILIKTMDHTGQRMQELHSVSFKTPFNLCNCTCMVLIQMYVCHLIQSINQCLLSIQTNNNNIHTFVNMNTERAGKK